MSRIMGMSLRQIQGFIDLSIKSTDKDSVAMAILVRMAYHGTGDQFKKFVKEMTEK